MYMIKNGSISTKNVIALYNGWLTLSGAYIGMGPETMSPMIDELHSYLMTNKEYHPYMINYRESDAGFKTTLLHSVFYGYDCKIITKVAKDLISLGLDPFARTVAPISESKNSELFFKSNSFHVDG